MLKMWVLLVLIVTVVMADDHSINRSGIVKRALPSSCTAKYAALQASTMCAYHDDPEVQHTGVNKIMQIVIVAEHNKYRRKVRPTATNMQKMYWDSEIAAVAQKWANTCPTGHDTNDNREIPGYGIHIGQNWARGYRSWDRAVKAWYDEVEMYRYGQDPAQYLPNGFMEIGHYTQVVRDVGARVGCGYSECPNLGKVYICNYAFGNPVDWGKPYESGPPCSTCPKSCKNNLCDCHGKICKNGGTLDANTCSCNCLDLWDGDTCNHLSCPVQDPEVCGAAWGYAPRRCEEWLNVPQECPYMCGLCTADDMPGSNSVLPFSGGDVNEGSPVRQQYKANKANTLIKTNKENQTGKGKNTNLPMCAAVDPDYCGQPQPYGFLPKHCKQWMNVPGECPAMCGRCQARCGGKTSAICKYGGKLNGESCSCDCKPPYGGENCETLVSCPVADPPECSDRSLGYSESQCDVMAYVRERCPVMCNLCEEKCPGLKDDACANEGTLNDDCSCTCTSSFTGDKCEKFVTCPRAKDEFWCKQFSAGDCAKYFNFPTDCPHMCMAC